MSAPFHELPLAASALSFQEAVTLKTHLDGLKRFLSAPGDWGYESMLGHLAIAVNSVQGATARHIENLKEAHPGL